MEKIIEHLAYSISCLLYENSVKRLWDDVSIGINFIQKLY